MLAAIIADGVVGAVIALGDKIIDPDGRAARGQAVFTVENADGAVAGVYEAVIEAPEGAILVATDEAAPGWTYADGEFSPPPGDPEEEKRQLVGYAADLRWQREVAGITVAGISIATDDRSKVMIVGARVAAEANPAWSTTWYGADGQVYPIDAPTMIAISAAVEAHVNSGFAIIAQIKAEIEAGSIATRAEIDAAFTT